MKIDCDGGEILGFRWWNSQPSVQGSGEWRSPCGLAIINRDCVKGSIAYWGGFSFVATLGVHIQVIKEDGGISWAVNIIKRRIGLKPCLSLLGNITAPGPSITTPGPTITAVKSGNWTDPSVWALLQQQT